MRRREKKPRPRARFFIARERVVKAYTPARRAAPTAARPAALRGAKAALARENLFVALAQLLAHPGLKNGVRKIGDRKGRLCAGSPVIVIGDGRMRGIVLDRPRAARGRFEPALIDPDPADARVWRKIGRGHRAPRKGANNRKPQQRIFQGGHHGNPHCNRSMLSRRVHVSSAFILSWFMPFISVRNLAEFVCVPPLFVATWLLIKEKNFRNYLFAGIWIGIAFSARFQTI